jgi:hypothetical protein
MLYLLSLLLFCIYFLYPIFFGRRCSYRKDCPVGAIDMFFSIAISFHSTSEIEAVACVFLILEAPSSLSSFDELKPHISKPSGKTQSRKRNIFISAGIFVVHVGILVLIPAVQIEGVSIGSFFIEKNKRSYP